MTKSIATLGCVLSERYMRKRVEVARQNRALRAAELSEARLRADIIIGNPVNTTGEETARSTRPLPLVRAPSPDEIAWSLGL